MLTFASSGSGAMESAVANLVRPAQPALVASCGKFGERWAELCDAFGADIVHSRRAGATGWSPTELERVLAENPGVDVVFTTLSETSTGVVNDVRALTEVAHRARRAARGRRRVGSRRRARARRTSGAWTSWSPGRRRR